MFGCGCEDEGSANSNENLDHFCASGDKIRSSGAESRRARTQMALRKPLRMASKRVLARPRIPHSLPPCRTKL